jgi:purine catabolism regulator
VEVSRFVDITKELNTLIINQDSDFYQNADLYENRLSSIKSKSKGSIIDGLRYTAEYLGIEVAYLPIKGRQYRTSPELRKFIESKLSMLEKAFAKDEIFYNGNIAIKQIKIYEQNWGYLVFKSRRKSISQFELLILNRLSYKICSETFLELLNQEEEIHKNNQWISKWLNGELKSAEIKEKLRGLGFNRNYRQFAVCYLNLCVQNPDSGTSAKSYHGNIEHRSWQELLLQINIVVQKIFTDRGCSILDFKKNDDFYYIIMFPEAENSIFDLLDEAIELLRIYTDKLTDQGNLTVIIGKVVNQYEELGRSYKSALETADGIESQGGIIVYDKLYMNRLFRRLTGEPVLDEFISDHLGVLMLPEHHELLHTLKVYFECNLSKQETSEKLFIARQTLYFRLNKIIDVLGEDFDAGERRFALEFAIHAYNYQKANQKI